MSGSFVGWVVGCVGLWGFFYVFWLDSGRAATGEPGRGSPHLSSSPRAHVEGQASARPVLPWRPVTQRRGLNLLREVGQGTRGRESSTANARGVPPNPPTSLAKATYGQQQTPREGRKGAGGGRRNDRTRGMKGVEARVIGLLEVDPRGTRGNPEVGSTSRDREWRELEASSQRQAASLSQTRLGRHCLYELHAPSANAQ